MDRPERSPPQPSWLRTLLPIGFILLTGGFISVVLMVLMPGMLMALAAIVFGFTALHYVVWGWWIGPFLRREAEEEERRKAD